MEKQETPEKTAPTETPTETPVEKTDEKPVEKTEEPAGDKPVEKTAEHDTLLTPKEESDEGEKTGESKDQETGEAPEAYEAFTIPEGLVMNEALLEKAGPVFKELGLTQEQAQRLVDLQAEGEVARMEAWSAQQTEWREAAVTDPEVGGKNQEEHAANVKMAIKFFKAIGTPELAALLNESGLGNHVELIRVGMRGQKAIGDDTITGTKPRQVAGQLTPREKAKRDYPNSPSIWPAE